MIMPHAGRPHSGRSQDTIERVWQRVEEEPSTSTRRRSQQLDISRSSLQRIQTVLSLFPYKVQADEASRLSGTIVYAKLKHWFLIKVTCPQCHLLNELLSFFSKKRLLHKIFRWRNNETKRRERKKKLVQHIKLNLKNLNRIRPNTNQSATNGKVD